MQQSPAVEQSATPLCQICAKRKHAFLHRSAKCYIYLHSKCLCLLLFLLGFRMSGGGTPFPNEGHISVRIPVMSDDHNRANAAATIRVFPVWPLCQTPHLFDLTEPLQDAPLGRSHRASVGKAKLAQAIDGTREILDVPADYRIGIVPASDTGAFEMAMWTMLGERPLRDGGVGKFRRRLGDGCGQAIAARRARARSTLWSDRGHGRARLRPGRLLHLERHDERRPHAPWRHDPGRPRGSDALRCDQRRIRAATALGQTGCDDVFVAESAGRRGGARDADPVPPARSKRLESPIHLPGRCRRSSA